MSNKTAVFFTAKSIERILREGGTSSWRLDRNHAFQCAFAVCTRNAHADWVEGQEAHRAAFLLGRVKDVVVSPDYEDRYLIQFTEYALVNIPDVWKGDRNPVKYSTLEELGIDPTKQKWEPMPKLVDFPGNAKSALKMTEVGALTMAEAKKGLSLTFGVAPEAIEITIRG
jgi:hypothetical protein